MQIIRNYIEERGEATTAEVAKKIGLSTARTRAILSSMDDVETVGVTNKRVYRIDK